VFYSAAVAAFPEGSVQQAEYLKQSGAAAPDCFKAVFMLKSHPNVIFLLQSRAALTIPTGCNPL